MAEAHSWESWSPGTIIYREEVTGILIALADINVKLGQIVDLLAEERDDEEEDEEDPT